MQTGEFLKSKRGIVSTMFVINTECSVTVGGEQLSKTTTSYQKVQAVEPVTSPTTNVQTYEPAVNAPATMTKIIGAGAVLPSVNPKATGAGFIFI